MTPAVLLVGFCAAMTAIAIGRLALDDDRNPVDAGTALVVLGITLLSGLWVTLEEMWLSLPGRILLAVVGFGTVGIGAIVISRHWKTESDAGRSQLRQADDDGDRA